MLCAPGGAAGVNADDGNLTITNSTITNNETTNQTGGGVSFTGDSRTMVMTNSIVSNNKAKGGANGEGGGLFVRQNVNGTVMIHSSTISNNTSESRAGGIKLESTPGTLNTTIDQGTVITGNTSLGTGDGISEGGGLDISILGAGTTTLKDVTITNNHANGESGNPSDPGTGGGIFNNLGTLNVSLSRITGNTAPTGSGLFRAAGTVTAENNWWGCDGFPGAAGCDTVSGTADVDPRLDLVVTATPSTILSGGTSSVKADVSKNSNWGSGPSRGPQWTHHHLQREQWDHESHFGPARELDGHEQLYQHELSRPPATVMAALDNGTDDASITITCPTTTTTTTSTTTTTTLPPTTTTTEPPPTTTTEPPPTTTTTTPPPTTTTTTLPPTTTRPLPCRRRSRVTVDRRPSSGTITTTRSLAPRAMTSSMDGAVTTSSMDGAVTTASAAGRGTIS